MKKYFFLIFVVTGVCSCASKIENNFLTEPLNEAVTFEQFLADLDSLNHSLGFTSTSETKGWERDLTKSIADAVGGALGKRFGTGVGATIGSAGGVLGAIVGAAIGKKAGGSIGTVVASTLAAVIYDWVAPGSVSNNPPIEGWSLTETYSADCGVNDSEGLIHNEILALVLSNGKQYVSEDGVINIDELFDDVSSVASQLNIEDPLYREEGYRAYMDDFYREIADITFQDAMGLLSTSYSTAVQDYLCKRKDFSVVEAQSVMNVISATKIAASMEDSQAIEYEKEFIHLVDESSLSTDHKELIKTTGSISIMSTYYWYAEK